MKWVNIKNKSQLYTLKEAILYNNLDGLFLPEKIPKIEESWLENISNYNRFDICFYVLKLFFSDDLSDNILKDIIYNSFDFDCIMKCFDNNNYILELFHGPTLAFKDYGTRFMSNVIKYLNLDDIRIVTATSGDTGAAVANAYSFTDIPVTIFYPYKKISYFQRKQITTNTKNISCIEVYGDFDDCQQIVKDILKNNKNIITANSINICRLIPQIVYYFMSYSKLCKLGKKVNYIIPSGNLGNTTACIITQLMGLPINQIIAACNENNTFSKFLESGIYLPQKSKKTVSNAMDIGNPSNFERIYYLFDKNIDKIRNKIQSYNVNDETTKKTIFQFYQKYNYLLDPHTAVGYSIKDKLDTDDNLNCFLSTASPYKFINILSSIINKYIHIPVKYNEILYKKSYNCYMKNDSSIINKLLKKKCITLIGMPGSGKTSISNSLQKNSWNTIETDKLITDQYNDSLVDIIKKYGNDKFIEIEKNIIQNIKIDNQINNHVKGTIISTGGSVVYDNDTMNFLKNNSIVIYLKVKVNDLIKRIKNFEDRGIILESNMNFTDLYNERQSLYTKYSDITIDNSYFSMNESINIINNLI